MKLYDKMDQKERGQFLVRAAMMMKEIKDETKAEQHVRPALIVLWAMSQERTINNLWTHYDIDPSGFIDEAVRQGVHFLVNLQRAIEMNPPPESVMDKYVLAKERARLFEVTDMVRRPEYRPVITEVFEDFFRDQRQEGNL